MYSCGHFCNPYNYLKNGLFVRLQKALFSRSSQNCIINGVKCLNEPWVVEIIVHHHQKWKHLCGGSLIHPNWVITAAHSFFQYDKENRPFAPNNAYKVCIGSSKLCGGVHYNISAIHHPSFEITLDRKLVLNDLALIKLPWSIPQHLATPISLVKNVVTKTYADYTGYIYGWGASTKSEPGINEFSPCLQKGTVTIVDNSQCHDITTQLDEGKICIDCDLSPSMACNGDSGGPLVVEENGRPVLIGISSYGDCNYENWDIYTRITSHLDWIQYITKLNEMELLTDEHENLSVSSLD